MPQRDFDNFTGYSNGKLATVSGGKWTKLSGRADMDIVSETVRQSNGGEETAAEITSWPWDTANQWSEILMVDAEVYGGPTILSNGVSSYYMVDARKVGVDTFVHLYYVNPSDGYKIVDSQLGNVADGQTVYLERVSGIITVKINGSTIISIGPNADTTALANGKPGMRTFTGNEPIMDAWKGGDFSSGFNPLLHLGARDMGRM